MPLDDINVDLTIEDVALNLDDYIVDLPDLPDLPEDLHAKLAEPRRGRGEHLRPVERAIVRHARLDGMTLAAAGKLVGCGTLAANRICRVTNTRQYHVLGFDHETVVELHMKERQRIDAALAAEIGLDPADELAKAVAWHAYKKYRSLTETKL